jgi:acyl-CoA synthetase (AMP-forming)/AMP-acid ligase II
MKVCVNAQASVTEKELAERRAVHLGDCKRPGEVALRRDPLLKTPAGKIKRKELCEPFGVDRKRRVAGN